MDLLDRKGVEYIDISENMIEETGLENTCELLHKIDSRIGCGAHYNARGYSVVAESIYDYILRLEEVAPKN